MEQTVSPILSPSPEKPIKKIGVIKSIFKEIFIFALIAFFVVLPFRMFVAEPYIVDGISMDPTFHTGDYLIVNKLSYEIGTPKRNTVIVIKFPLNPSKKFIKRMIGLPGDTIEIDGNTVRITNKENPKGFVIDQSYLVHKVPDSPHFSLKKTLGPEEYFVMGDNRKESYDSRYWGVLPKADIVGIPILRLFPFTQIGILPGDDRK